MTTLGTAGHVDHGKSTLVQALTGIDPDRLAEEKARGMTIELGFAWLTLPDGRSVSIVDVPGHEDFIKQMIAGVGGIDVALLVVAADEGIMPQTTEHLGILDLLRVSRGIVALTKADLVDDDWRDLVAEDIAKALAPTTLAGSPIIPVSAMTGAGLSEFIAAISAAIDVIEQAPRRDEQPERAPRLPVDRAFTIAGFGTVVTGTLLDGPIATGQDVVLLPGDLRGRVRGIQTHKEQASLAQPGSRVALNLAGVAHHEVKRGMVVTTPHTLTESSLVDVRLATWRSAPRAITHNMPVDLFVGAAVVPVRVALLEVDMLDLGESAWAQLRLSAPVAVARGDRFIVRNASPSETLGGGMIVDPTPRFHRRRQAPVLARLASLASGEPQAIIQVTLASGRGPRRWMTLAEITAQTRLTLVETHAALDALIADGGVLHIGDGFLTHVAWDEIRESSARILNAYHERFPLRVGMPREDWRSQVDIGPRMIETIFAKLTEERAISEVPGGTLVRLPGHMPRFTAAQTQALAVLLARMAAEPYNPPPRSEIETLIGREVLAAVVEGGTLTRLSEDVVLTTEAFSVAREAIIAFLREHGHITVSDVRDLLGASRRIIVPLLETLDAQRVTRRAGDSRVLGAQG